MRAVNVEVNGNFGGIYALLGTDDELLLSGEPERFEEPALELMASGYTTGPGADADVTILQSPNRVTVGGGSSEPPALVHKSPMLTPVSSRLAHRMLLLARGQVPLSPDEELRRQLAAAKQALSVAEARVAATAQDRADVVEQRSRIRAQELQLTEYRGRVAELETTATRAAQAEAALRQQARALSAQVRNLQEFNEELEDSRARLEMDIRDGDELRPELQRQLTSLTAAKRAAEAEVAKRKREAEDFEAMHSARVRELQDKIDALEAQVANARPDILLEARMRDWAEQRQALEAQLEEAREMERRVEAADIECVCTVGFKRVKLACGHALCAGCTDKLAVCPYCRAEAKEVARV